MFKKELTQCDGKNLIILLTMKEEEGLAENIFRAVEEAMQDADFKIAVYEVNDWNGDFSPWEYRMTDGRYFAGNGKNTLENICSSVMDKCGNGGNTIDNICSPVHDECDQNKNTLDDICSSLTGEYEHIYIAGYSLAGLFSLWAVHETDMFDGCACCSGSLWFNGWESYSETHVSVVS